MKYVFTLAAFLLLSSISGIAQNGNLVPPKFIDSPANHDEYFFNFRLINFSPDTEPLICETFGHDFEIQEDGFWEHYSYTSHAVGFATNLPSISVIEYGETTEYGSTTEQSDSYYYQHLHYIKGLEPNETYHYRIKAQDHNGNLIVSEDHVFTTKEMTNVIKIPDDFPKGAPYVLTTSNAQYVLTRNITVPTMAINIKANNVSIDLDGHTIIYDNGTPKVISNNWTDYLYNEDATFGIRTGLWNFKNVRLYNGIIRQGKNGGKGVLGGGFNPVFLSGGDDSFNEIAGITVDYYGDNIDGMNTGDGDIHHNVLIDRGSGIDNRHTAIHAILLGESPDNEISYNSLRRFRHQGIMGSGEKHHNELYSDSFDTNSYLIDPGPNGKVYNNKMFGMGYNPVGTFWANNTVINNNFIYLHGTAPTMRSIEYARLSGIAGVRFTLYGGDAVIYDNCLYEDNVIVLKAWEGCTDARGLWTCSGENNKGTIYRRNTVKVEAVTDKIDFSKVEAITAVDINGGDIDINDPLPHPVIFEDNHFISNVNLISFGSAYGVGERSYFYRTRMDRINKYDANFEPVNIGFWRYISRDNRIIDAIPGEGVDLEKAPNYTGTNGYMEIFYGMTKELQLLNNCESEPLSNTAVTISPTGFSPISEKTNSEGVVTAELLTVRHLKADNVETRTDYAPYTFSVNGFEPHSLDLEALKNAVYLSFGCGATFSTEISDVENIIVHPNPAKEYVKITGLKGHETIRMFDMAGHIRITAKAQSQEETILVNNLPSGIYLVCISDNSVVRTLKLTKL